MNPWLIGVAWLVAVDLIEVHGPDGQRAYVNTHEISSLREPADKDLRQHFPPKVHCVVMTTNGKFLAVTETCDQIRNVIIAHP